MYENKNVSSYYTREKKEEKQHEWRFLYFQMISNVHNYLDDPLC